MRFRKFTRLGSGKPVFINMDLVKMITELRSDQATPLAPVVGSLLHFVGESADDAIGVKETMNQIYEHCGVGVIP